MRRMFSLSCGTAYGGAPRRGIPADFRPGRRRLTLSEMAQEQERDLFRLILSITTIVLLLVLSLWIMRPFLPAMTWATMVAVATWPMMLAVQRRLWNKRWLATTVMTLAMLLVFVVPFSLAIGTLVVNMDEITTWVKSLDVSALETPPAWVAGIPGVGPKLDALWRELGPSADLSGNDHGLGRDLFAHLRRGIGGAESGASLLGELAAA